MRHSRIVSRPRTCAIRRFGIVTSGETAQRRQLSHVIAVENKIKLKCQLQLITAIKTLHNQLQLSTCSSDEARMLRVSERSSRKTSKI